MAKPAWDPNKLPDLTGRTYLVTGSNRGLGFFATEQLARAGARVLMTGRNPNRLAAARAAIERRRDAAADAPPGPLLLDSMILDTSHFGSVRSAAASISGKGGLDGVLLNAGIVHPPEKRTTTSDGHELVFATNVLGHFALAGVLLPTLAAAAGRMVWLGSISTSLWQYDPVDPQLLEGYTPWRAYVQSRVAATALGLEADRRLRAEEVPVSSVVAHPGYSISGRTPEVHGVNEPSRSRRFAHNLQTPVSQSKERGAWTLVRALADPGIESGEFWGPRLATRGAPRRSEASKIGRDTEVAERLWTVCEAATGVRWPFAMAAKAGLRR